MKVSVALATYNGERFLAQQLESLAAQTRPPDEIVACDDASTDGTVAILRRFGIEPLVQPRRLGTNRNFESAIARCSGEIILLCDQDDVWFPGKIEQLASSRAGCLFTDATRIDEAGNTLSGSLWEHIGFTPGGDLFETLCTRNVATGATMAFRASLRETILPIPEGVPHDHWIALIAAAANTLEALPREWIAYREHSAQQRGAGEPAGGLRRWLRLARETPREDFARRAAELTLLRERIGNVRDLDGRIEHLRRRASLPDRRWQRVPHVLGDTAQYVRYSRHVWSIAKDLFW
jgi:glycosyltransferase involved in cell wall biosynthesis